MTILVTGGAGFIGSNFLQRFVRSRPDDEFVCLDAFTYAANPLSLDGLRELPNFTLERASVADAEEMMDQFADWKPSLVVHFAAESHVDRSLSEPDVFVKTNVNGTFNLLEACRRANWRPHFHHVSTDEVYGSLGEAGFFTEETRYDPSSPYSASKAASDHLVRAYHRSYGVRVTITNCSNNYGPRQHPEKLIPLMISNMFDRKPLPIYGQGVNVRDWLYVDDHCEAIWAVIERGRLGETYNVGGNQEKTNIEVIEWITQIVSEETGAPLDELRALRTYVTDRPGHDLRYAIDASKISRECGWMPTETFESGLRKTVRWYAENDAWRIASLGQRPA